ncbi:MAG TPA: ECF transporter S component [Acholeplasma sp.]|nr:ECF transporter S component [Acholeplasma sp.]
MVQKELRKITLAATLTAVSIVLDILFKLFIPPTFSFGFPFYAIPLVVGSIVLGPIYGGIMGFLSDLIGFYSNTNGYTYDILFALQAISWGVIPYFLAKRNSNWLNVGIAVTVSHIIATTFSSVADYVGSLVWNGGNVEGALSYMWIYTSTRLMIMPANIVIITAVVNFVNQRLAPVYDAYIGPLKLKENSK